MDEILSCVQQAEIKKNSEYNSEQVLDLLATQDQEPVGDRPVCFILGLCAVLLTKLGSVCKVRTEKSLYTIFHSYCHNLQETFKAHFIFTSPEAQHTELQYTPCWPRPHTKL